MLNTRHRWIGAIAALALLAVGTGVAPVASRSASAAAGDDVVAWVEAESMTREGGVAGSGPHNNQSGLGFITIREPPEGLSFSAQAPEAGTYPVWIRYANGALGGSPPERTISLVTNGSSDQITLAPSDPFDWETWEVFRTDVALDAGSNALAIRCVGDDECHLNLDVVQVGGTTFDPRCPAVDPGVGYTAMFDGTFDSLDMWRKGDHYGSGGVDGGVGLGRQADCSMQTAGGTGSEWFLGPQPGASPPFDAPYTLQLDFRQNVATDDSGVFIGSPDHGDTPSGGIQVDIAQGTVGAVAGVQPADAAAVADVLRPAGEWNSLTLLVEANRVRVRLNGRLVNDYTSAASLSGYVGLEFAGDPNKVNYRNIRSKPGVAADPVATTTSATVTAGAGPGSAVLTARVAAASGVPAGSVVVTGAGVHLGSGTLGAAGIATITLSGLAPGTHTFVVAYQGTAPHVASDITVSYTVAPPGPGPDPDPDPEPEPQSAYVAIEPGRLLDTRDGASTVDGRFARSGRMAANATATVRIGGRGGVPADASAAVLNVTATDTGADGYLTVWPCDAPRPNASSVNFAAGETMPNTVVAGLDVGGYVCIFTSAPTHLIVDASGHLPGGDGYTPLVPARLTDTRSIGTPAPGYALRIPVAGRGGVPAAGVGAAALNVTVTGATRPGYLSVYPCGGATPATSTLNFVAGQTVANAVVTALAATGDVCVFVGEAAAHVIVDVNGWFASGVRPTAPQRALDSRRSGKAAPGYTVRVPVAGRGAVPAGAAIAVLNLTAVDPDGVGYLTAHRCGTPVPNASNVNFAAGRNAANLAYAPLDDSGMACVHVAGAATDLLVDVAAWLPAAP